MRLGSTRKDRREDARVPRESEDVRNCTVRDGSVSSRTQRTVTEHRFRLHSNSSFRNLDHSYLHLDEMTNSSPQPT